MWSRRRASDTNRAAVFILTATVLFEYQLILPAERCSGPNRQCMSSKRLLSEIVGRHVTESDMAWCSLTYTANSTDYCTRCLRVGRLDTSRTC